MNRTNKLTIISFFCILLIITACSGKKLDSNGREELVFGEAAQESANLNEMLEVANKKYEEGNRSLAYARYKTIVEQFPKKDLPEARLRLVEIAHQTANFANVPELADLFAKFNAQSEAVPYVWYLAGLSAERSYGGIGRDTSVLKIADSYYSKIIASHEGSDYYLAARKGAARIEKKRLDHQQYISDYYLKSGNKAASQARLAQ